MSGINSMKRYKWMLLFSVIQVMFCYVLNVVSHSTWHFIDISAFFQVKYFDVSDEEHKKHNKYEDVRPRHAVVHTIKGKP